MTAGTYHLEIEQGSTFGLTITYKDGNGDLVNLTGYTARMHLRKNIDDSDTVLALTTENGGITLGGSNGTVTLAISATDTAALTSVEGVYDLELVTGAVVEKLIAGVYTVKREVTR